MNGQGGVVIEASLCKPIRLFRHSAILLGLLFFFFSCATAPVTERRGLHLVPDSELVAHAIAKHGNERISQGLLTQFGAIGLSLALAGNPGVTSNIFMQAYGVGTQIAFLLPYSRVHESEADHIGLS